MVGVHRACKNLRRRKGSRPLLLATSELPPGTASLACLRKHLITRQDKRGLIVDDSTEERDIPLVHCVVQWRTGPARVECELFGCCMRSEKSNKLCGVDTLVSHVLDQVRSGAVWVRDQAFRICSTPVLAANESLDSGSSRARFDGVS